MREFCSCCSSALLWPCQPSCAPLYINQRPSLGYLLLMKVALSKNGKSFSRPHSLRAPQGRAGQSLRVNGVAWQTKLVQLFHVKQPSHFPSGELNFLPTCLPSFLQSARDFHCCAHTLLSPSLPTQVQGVQSGQMVWLGRHSFGMFHHPAWAKGS